jgi:hypothetical protein
VPVNTSIVLMLISAWTTVCNCCTHVWVLSSKLVFAINVLHMRSVLLRFITPRSHRCMCHHRHRLLKAPALIAPDQVHALRCLVNGFWHPHHALKLGPSHAPPTRHHRYRATSRELHRLDSTSKSPIFGLCSESVGARVTIRAFKMVEHFLGLSDRMFDKNLKV